ncbi:MAG: PIN domain nuclease [Nitrospirae bacterium]|nr:PIN domain nuclease [Nitrospirota bacterium]
MVLVDTSVWIDFFQGPASPYADILDSLVRENNRAVICGLVLQEILQGIKDDRSHALTKERLSVFPFINTNKDTYIHASHLYRNMRKKGITIPPADATIAAIALANKIPLFTKDEHFRIIARHSDLTLYSYDAD